MRRVLGETATSSVVGLIPAAGLGTRFGGALPKTQVRIGGLSVLQHALQRLSLGGVHRFVVAVEATRLEEVVEELADRDDTLVVVGGATRQESVGRCFDAGDLSEQDWIVVHDAARPAVSPRDVKRTLAAARKASGAVLGRSVTDTVKKVEAGRILATVDRAQLFRAETPQVFSCSVFRDSRKRALSDGFVGTDESSLVERYPGARVSSVVAREPNPKLTHREDLNWVEHLLGLPLSGE